MNVEIDVLQAIFDKLSKESFDRFDKFSNKKARIVPFTLLYPLLEVTNI